MIAPGRIQNGSQSRTQSGNEDLQFQFEQAVADGCHWTEILELIYNNRSFKKKLSSAAAKTARRSRLPHQAKEDIQQEALYLLANALKENPSLGYDRGRGDFSRFLGTVIFNSCKQSYRGLYQRERFDRLTDFNFNGAYDTRQLDDERMDLAVALASIDEPQVTVLELFADGFSVREISEQMKYSRRSTYRLLNSGLDELREFFCLR